MAKVTRSMPCPICGSDTRVPQTKGVVYGEVHRMRECFGPKRHRFITREVFMRDVKTRKPWVTQVELFDGIAERIATHIVKGEEK